MHAQTSSSLRQVQLILSFSFISFLCVFITSDIINTLVCLNLASFVCNHICTYVRPTEVLYLHQKYYYYSNKYYNSKFFFSYLLLGVEYFVYTHLEKKSRRVARVIKWLAILETRESGFKQLPEVLYGA